MKKLILLCLLMPLAAHAYTSPEGTDPSLVSGAGIEVEYKSVKKSVTAGYSDAISKGQTLWYDENNFAGAYLVSRSMGGTYANTTTQALGACVASRDVATGDTSVFNCVVRGYVDYALYDVGAGDTSSFVLGQNLCISNTTSAKSKLVGCASGVVSAKFISLQTKTAAQSGSDLKVLVQSR